MNWFIENGGKVDVKVSSVLNNDVKQFGKKHIVDQNEETCWNSKEGSPQWVFLTFQKTEVFKSFRIQFQGGFVGQDCKIEFYNDSELVDSEFFYPEDNNSAQLFNLCKNVLANRVKFIFGKSTDIFGRIVIYLLDVDINVQDSS